MLQILWAAVAALILASCGGGGGADTTLSVTPSSAAFQVRRAAPGSTLLAGPVSVVNTPTKGTLGDIGATSDGGYVIAWLSGSSAIYIQAYDRTGAKAGVQAPLQVEIPAPTVIVLNDGTVAVVYLVVREIVVDGSVERFMGVYFKRFDASGNQLMGETLIASLQESPFNPRAPYISGYSARALSGGGFVVAWTTTNYVAPGLPNRSSLTLRWFDSQGQPQGAPMQAASLSDLRLSSMEADAHGGVALSAVYVEGFFQRHYAVWHYDANRILQPVVAPGLSPMLLLPLQGGYVLFTRGDCDPPCTIAGPTAQILDSQGNPIGTSTPIPSMPSAARELADGTYVAIWFNGATYAAQRFAADGTPLGEPVAIDSNRALPRIASLANTGFAAAWTDPGATGDADVFTQRFVERFSERKKACLNSAKGLKGQERKAFVDACVG